MLVDVATPAIGQLSLFVALIGYWTFPVAPPHSS